MLWNFVVFHEILLCFSFLTLFFGAPPIPVFCHVENFDVEMGHGRQLWRLKVTRCGYLAFMFLWIKFAFVYSATVGRNVTIWLANFPLSIRVQSTLVASMCHAMPLSSSRWIKITSWVRNILTAVITVIVVDKSTDHAKPLSICQIDVTEN